MIRLARRLSGPLLAWLLVGGPALAAVDGAAVLNAKCASCHERKEAGGLSRISEQRKTPEGWLMTLRRMQVWHGLRLTGEEEKVLVKHLADTQGLAPAEAAPFRYVLERRPGVVETPDDAELATFCGRCHTYARVGLQRRDEHDWVKLVHTHLGQWPTIEYQAMARDRQWFKLATTEIAAKLGKKWPLQTPAWTEWRDVKQRDLSGSWRVAGHRPGKGQYDGRMLVERAGPDEYAVTMDITYANGSKASGKGSAIVYTGYEWRGTVDLAGEDIRQVFTVDADGKRLSGRWFDNVANAIGGDLGGVRAAQPAILAVQPSYLKAGETTRLTIVGAGLDGEVRLGGAKVVKTVSASPDRIVVEAQADKDSAVGPCTVSVGDTQREAALVIYDNVAAVRVEPSMDIARLGGGGGPIPHEPAQFQAVGYMAGADGKPGTEDDVRIGVMPATWTAANYDKLAEELDDVKHVGVLEANGLFRPADAGINPARGELLNNNGQLTVKAMVKDGATAVEGTARLIVVPQRWNNPPIL